MMLRDYIQQNQRQLLEQQTDFYTPTGIHVFFKDQIENEEIDSEAVVANIESLIPHHLLSEVEMIIVGWFDEFEERGLNAFYDGGTLYVSNIQDDEADMTDDVIHEISHSLEEPHGYFLYGDKKIEEEFLRKRKYLHDVLWKMGYKAPITVRQACRRDEGHFHYSLRGHFPKRIFCYRVYRVLSSSRCPLILTKSKPRAL